MQVTRALINQVTKASDGNAENEVLTFITKPLWEVFLKEIGLPSNSKPTEWTSVKGTIRVYGSKTVVVNGTKKMESFSVLMARFPKSKR